MRAVMAALCLTATMAVAIAAVPPQAHANFTLKHCEGSEITGEGSSLQVTAQADWISQIFDTTAAGEEASCGAKAPLVTYTKASSGCGLDAMGAGEEASKCVFAGISESERSKWEKPGFRPENVRFGASDFAPDEELEKNMDDGPNGAGQPGSGEVHVIPVAGAAITAIVHFPEGCALQNPEQVGGNGNTSTGGINDPGGKDSSDDLFSNQTLRVHIPDQKLEEIWQGHITKWGEVVEEKYFLSGTTHSQKECAETPIIRIVREDTSGTTYNFKHFLALLPFSGSKGGAELWTSASSEVGKKNTAWPIKSATETGVPNPVNSTNNVCEEAVHICRAKEGSGSSLAAGVTATSGSIGYLDLATAREKGFYMAPNESCGAGVKVCEPGVSGYNEKASHRTYWIPLEPVIPSKSENGVGTLKDPGVFVEPTVEAKAHFNGADETKGANCAGADWRGYPRPSESPNGDPTLANWSKAIATGGTQEAVEDKPTIAYPVCAITYDLAFDDDAAAYKNDPEEEAKARTVKDYLTAVVSPLGQFALPEFDYAALPIEFVEDAEKGVEAIGWDKAAGSSSSNNNNSSSNNSSGGNTGTTTTTTGVVTAVTPSNAFSIASAKVKGKDIVLSLVLPDAGTLQVKATGGGVTVGSVNASTSGGKGTVTLAISKVALSKLAKAKGHKLSVKITVTFTPTGGTAASQTKTLTVTQTAVTTKKKASKKGKKK